MIVTKSHVLLVAAASLAPELRIALFALIALLLITLGFLGAMVLGLRRSPEPASPRRELDEVMVPMDIDDTELAELLMIQTVHASDSVALDAGGGTVACRTCQREYAADLEFCPRDARRLVPAAEVDAKTKGGSVCPTCRRTFDSGVRFCPYDAAGLLPVSLYEVTHGATDSDMATGRLSKICPQCEKRYDSAATFCGKDGADLAVLN